MATPHKTKQTVLEVLAAAPEALSIAKIAAISGIPYNRASILARELEAAGLVRQACTTRPIRYASIPTEAANAPTD
jgi:DNA-binding IclR family transcriptional regulator